MAVCSTFLGKLGYVFFVLYALPFGPLIFIGHMFHLVNVRVFKRLVKRRPVYVFRIGLGIGVLCTGLCILQFRYAPILMVFQGPSSLPIYLVSMFMRVNKIKVGWSCKVIKEMFTASNVTKIKNVIVKFFAPFEMKMTLQSDNPLTNPVTHVVLYPVYMACRWCKEI